MFKFSLLLLLILSIGQAFAEDGGVIKLSNLKAQNASQLTKAELLEILPGAKVKNITAIGSTRIWENSPDGKFAVTSDSRGGDGRISRGDGSWSIGDDGRYCVSIEWKRSTEKWCRYLHKVGDKYFGTDSITNTSAVAHEFLFSR